MQEKALRVVITGSRDGYMWYRSKIGKQFQVLQKEFIGQNNYYIYWVRTDDELHTKNFIYDIDCKEIE